MTTEAMKDGGALVAAISAINEGVAEMLATGADLPSINASLRVGRSVRKVRAQPKE